MWHRLALLLLVPLAAAADDLPAAAAPPAAAPPAAAAAADDSPAAKLRTARALLDARGAHRERRVYTSPNPLTQVVEFSGKRQLWITEFNDDGKRSRQETVWEGGRSATRRIPGASQWQCNPPIDDKFTEPEATVTDGGAVTANGRAAHRYVEQFFNEMTHGTVRHLVDVDDESGLPLQLTSTEADGGIETRYVGTYYDVGATITIDFPAC